MLRTVCDALRTAVRMASATLVSLLPTTSVSRYTWSLTGTPPAAGWGLDRGRKRCPAGRSRTSHGASASPYVRRSGSREYAVRRIPGDIVLRRLRHVPTDAEGALPMSVMTLVPTPRTAPDSCMEEDGRGLLDALAAGDEATWSTTVRRFEGLLRSAARVVLRSDADIDEAVQ